MLRTKAVVAGSAVLVGGVWIRRHRMNLRMAWYCLTGKSVMYKMHVDLGRSVRPMTRPAHIQESIVDGLHAVRFEDSAS